VHVVVKQDMGEMAEWMTRPGLAQAFQHAVLFRLVPDPGPTFSRHHGQEHRSTVNWNAAKGTHAVIVLPPLPTRYRKNPHRVSAAAARASE
jgi:hypothetical protein